MAGQASAPNQIISLPKGGGAQKGIGEKFSPDLHTGTGNFTVPLALPPGRNGFQPQLNLAYSTGTGNGVFGLGWALSIPGITRKASKGIPRYRDYDLDIKKRDTFILSGAEDLVPIQDSSLDPTVATRYRPRTEGLFAKIVHHHDQLHGINYWEVCSKDGLISYYGINPAEPQTDDPTTYDQPFRTRTTPATITKPKLNVADPDRVFAWKLTLTKDPFGNRIEYLYETRDQSDEADERQGHQWDQPLLTQIRYADYKQNPTKFLVTVTFDYEARLDSCSDYRAGFEIRTSARCRSILVTTHADKDYPVRRYDLRYENETLNKVSLLTSVDVIGFDDAGNEAKELPPLQFSYSRFNPQDQQQRDFYPVEGADLPATSLANTSMELVDLFGNGLPDILEMNGTVRYWRNRGGGRFDLPKPMAEAPAGLALGDPGVQLIDANGDGRSDLLVTQGTIAGYYPLLFNGRWDRRSFQKYRTAPSFDLKDPEVRLLDLTGDGVTDCLRSGTSFECFFNDPLDGWNETRRVQRQGLTDFPNVNLSDPRVKLADMSGDGMQDIVLVHDGNVEYWPNLGYGNWGKRLHMAKSPRFPYGYDPKRILVGDVDGDGFADILYIDNAKVTLWINQSGNGWSEPIEILGTPPVTDMDSIRVIDLLGSGISGVLWTRDASSSRQDHYLFLDLTGGTKPYMLQEMNNNMGAVTKVSYAPSTEFYLDDEPKPALRWRTPLPFPVQCVARVEVIDALSQGKLTTEYRYHHGYWDGAEREFRGFGFVEQLDTETFDRYNERGLHGRDVSFIEIQDRARFSPPMLTKTWFHQGPIGEEFGDWEEHDWSTDYWTGDPPLLAHARDLNDVLTVLDLTYAGKPTRERRRIKRDALRTLRGSILRTELYALDGSPQQGRPYTVTEQAYSLSEIDQPASAEPTRLHIFFPHAAAQRTTQWERGDDPMTQFSFTEDYDAFGQARSQTTIACPRGWRRMSDRHTDYLATRTRTGFAEPSDPTATYLYDRVAKSTTYEIRNTSARNVLECRDLKDTDPALVIIGHTVNWYDGAAFEGAVFGAVQKYGALVRSETLVLTRNILQESYKSADRLSAAPEEPAYLRTDGNAIAWTQDYPQEFQDRLPPLAGYLYRTATDGGHYVDGFYTATERRQYDFHLAHNGEGKGLFVTSRDPMGHDTRVVYDNYLLLPSKVTDAVGMMTTAIYNYRVLQPTTVIDPNNNKTAFTFTPMGLLKETWLKGKDDAARPEGDRQEPSAKLLYDFWAFVRRKEPISVQTIRRVHHDTEIDVPAGSGEGQRDETIETREYSDGFGRLLQTRTQAETVLFGDNVFGGGILPENQADEHSTRSSVQGTTNVDPAEPNVVVSGWQTYDNKGRVIEKYEPFYAKGWDYQPIQQRQLGQKVTMYYDPRGQVIRTVNPDGTEQRVIFGIPTALDRPDQVTATPWERYTYDANDLAPISSQQRPDGTIVSLSSRASATHHYTPASALLDALGRVVETVERNGVTAADRLIIRTTYDIRGNVLTITDSLGRLAFRHVYDLANRPWRIESLDAGLRRMVLDAIENEVERRDSKGSVSVRAYDQLHRPTHLWAKDATQDPVTLRERLIYGDQADSGLTETAQLQKNLKGRLYQHYDEAGRLQAEQCDFKGNLTTKFRQVIQDSELTKAYAMPPYVAYRVDWTPQGVDTAASRGQRAAALLDQIRFDTSTSFDALNRIKVLTYPPDGAGNYKKFHPRYNRAGNLESVTVDNDVYVERIAYNAKGQRTLIAYGNQVMTRYAYNPQTFRLTRLRTETYNSPDSLAYHPTGQLLQDFGYDYDLVGNILAITERVAGCGIANTPEGPNALNRSFSYDALYRLLSATGRESTNIALPRPWSDETRAGFNSPNHGSVDQDNAPHLTRPYKEEYRYDPAGNLLTMKHSQDGQSWTRHFGMGGLTPKEWADEWPQHVGGMSWQSPPSNRLTQVGDDVTTFPATHTYDANGNMVQETTNRHFEWDQADRLKAFSVSANNATSLHAQYLYDAAGQRVKKLVRNQQDQVEITVYIDGIFEWHEWTEGGQTKNNAYLHVMDNQNRVALVRIGDVHRDDGGPAIQYHLGDHLGSSTVIIGGNAYQANSFINREELFPYGETSFGSFGKKRYRFTGKERDEESRLNYHGARFYAPWLARWVSSDPGGPIDGINLYPYSMNSPIVVRDPSGLAADSDTPGKAANTLGAKTQMYGEKLLHALGIEFSPNVVIDSTGAEVPSVNPGKLPPRPKNSQEIDVKKQKGPDLEFKASGKPQVSNKYLREKADEIAPQAFDHLAVTGKSQTVLVVSYNKGKVAVDLMREKLQLMVDARVGEFKDALKALNYELYKKVKDLKVGVGVTTIDKILQVAKNKAALKTLGRSPIVKSVPLIPAIITLTSSDASAAERVSRAIAGEIGIGPMDLETVFDLSMAAGHARAESESKIAGRMRVEGASYASIALATSYGPKF